MSLPSPSPKLANHVTTETGTRSERTRSRTGHAVTHPERVVHHEHDAVAVILEAVSDQAEVRPIVFDRKHALSRLGGLEDLLREVLHVMLEESPKCHTRMRSAFTERDATGLARVAHLLKGSASIVGASDLCTRLLRIERLATTGDFAAVAMDLPEVDRQLAEMQHNLRVELRVVV